ncbi:hypothetical protein DL95DRAFT_320599 [Leptodontidium sp. 2 PMI_412]|nr:hypothetical protein DL95DRAFT_320599 [Leptodontidium sp. 2 PMI_412]
MKPLQPNHKEPPKLQERHHQGVYRRRLISMIAFFLVGVLMCIGHHLYYTSLVGQVVGNVDDQQTALRYGTTFAYLAQVCLVTPVGFAYTQWLWKGLERKIVTVNALDAAFGARTSILSLLDAEILWKTRAGLILAFIVWCNLAPPLITPATLFVNPSLVPHYTMTAVPCFNISGPGQPERFAYSVPAKDSGANGLGANNLSGIFLGPRTIINRLSAATAAQGEILPIIPPFVNASYQLQFYGPTVDCQAANSSIAAIIDNKANELPALQGSVEFSNAYFAFVPYMSDSGYKAIPSNRLQQPTNGSNQLWMKFSAFVINSMGQQNPEPRYLVCQLYNASYNISLDFVEGHQTITNNSLLILNEVDYPQADLIAPSDLVQYAYSAVMWAFTDLLTGSMGFCNDKSPNSLSFAFSETNTPILDTSLLGTSDLDVIFDMCHALHSSSDSNTISGQRLHDIQLARNQTLDVLIPELAYNITLSFMSDSLLSPSITTNVTTQDSVNLYAYHSMKLLLSYGATIFFALIAIILAAFAYLDNGVSNDRSFSSILSSSRMPGLSEPFHAQLPLRLPLSPSLRFTRVEGGLSFNTASSRFTNTIEGESMAEGIFGRSSAGRKFKHDQLNILPARLLSAFRRIIRPSLAQGYIRITWTCVS